MNGQRPGTWLRRARQSLEQASEERDQGQDAGGPSHQRHESEDRTPALGGRPTDRQRRSLVVAYAASATAGTGRSSRRSRTITRSTCMSRSAGSRKLMSGSGTRARAKASTMSLSMWTKRRRSSFAPPRVRAGRGESRRSALPDPDGLSPRAARESGVAPPPPGSDPQRLRP